MSPPAPPTLGTGTLTLSHEITSLPHRDLPTRSLAVASTEMGAVVPTARAGPCAPEDGARHHWGFGDY